METKKVARELTKAQNIIDELLYKFDNEKLEIAKEFLAVARVVGIKTKNAEGVIVVMRKAIYVAIDGIEELIRSEDDYDYLVDKRHQLFEILREIKK